MTQPKLASKRFEARDALEAIEMYYEKGWTDGLPVVPPTEDRILAFLEACGRRPDEVVGTIPARNRVLTAEKVAINAIMAGCLPSYAPVVMAAVQALTTDRFNLHGCTTSTGGSAPLAIVSGPIIKKLGLNSGGNVFGPGCRANATIGRSLRLVLMNLCGSTPGILDRSTLGHPGKYSYCIAENEEASPWEPLAVDKGFSEGTSTLSLTASEAPHYASNASSYEPQGILNTLADVMSALGNFADSDWVVVIGPEHAGVIRRHGWSRADVRSYLVERCARSKADLKRCGRRKGEILPGDDQEMVPLLSSPEKITVLVAGGGPGVFSAAIPPWAGGGSSRMVTLPIVEKD